MMRKTVNLLPIVYADGNLYNVGHNLVMQFMHFFIGYAIDTFGNVLSNPALYLDIGIKFIAKAQQNKSDSELCKRSIDAFFQTSVQFFFLKKYSTGLLRFCFKLHKNMFRMD